MEEKDFKELLKKWNITNGWDKCEDAVNIIEKTLLEGIKKDMIEAIEKIKTSDDMRRFTLSCAKALLKYYERNLDLKCDKKK